MFGTSVDKKYLLSVGIGLGCGLLCGWLFRGRLGRPKLALPLKQGEYKMVLVVRSDLTMSSGKVAAQTAHAAVEIFSQLRADNSDLLARWMGQGMPKVVVKTDNEASLVSLYNKACDLGLPCYVVRDAGRTEVQRGTKTVLGVGPGPARLVDKVTGGLKLL